MKQLFIICALLCALTCHSQQIKPKEIVPLFKFGIAEVEKFLVRRGFALEGEYEGIYKYEKPGLDACIVDVAFKNKKLSMFSVQQSIAYYNGYTTYDLTELGFKRKKLFPANLKSEIPGRGHMFLYNNDSLKLKCSVLFPIREDYSFTMVYGKM